MPSRTRSCSSPAIWLELRLGQKAHDAWAVDAAANRLLGRSGDAPVPAIPGLRAAVLLAQASSHLWHGRHEDVGTLLDEALAEARDDEMAGLELEVLAMIAFVESYWSRTHHAEDAARRAHVLLRHKNLGVPPALELAAALRSLVSGNLGGRMRSVQRILLPDVVGSDPGLAVALALGQARVLMTGGEVNEARAMLQETGPRIPPLLAVMRDVMLADLDTSLGRPHAALKLLRNYQGGELAILTAIPSARAHLALSDLRSAQDCVRAVLTTPSAQTGRFLLVEAMLCDAEIAQRSDDPGRALEILIRALEIAQGEIVLPFLNMKDVFGALLTRHPTCCRPVAGTPPEDPGGLGRRAARGEPQGPARTAHPARTDHLAPPDHEHVHLGDRRRAVPVGEHGQDPPGRHLPQASRQPPA